MGFGGLSFAGTASPCNRTGTTVWSMHAQVSDDYRSLSSYDDFSALTSFFTILSKLWGHTLEYRFSAIWVCLQHLLWLHSGPCKPFSWILVSTGSPAPSCLLFFILVVLRQDHRQPWLAWSSLCRQSCSRTHRDDPASAPGILGLKSLLPHLALFFLITFLVIYYMFMCVYGGGVCAIACIWKSEDILWELVLSFCLIDHMDRTQIVKHGGKCSSLLNQLSMTGSSFL